jgi:hypothetical protein
MPVITNSVRVRCTPEEAFDFLSDHRAELEWNPRCRAMEKLTDGPVGVGTRYRAKWKGSPHVELETVAFDRPHSWTTHNGGPLEVRFTCTVEPDPVGTRLQVEFEPTPHGPLRLVFPLLLRSLRRDELANMTHLREALERRSRDRPPPH